MLAMLAYFYWNPDSTFFTIPYLDHPVKWYGFLFMLGFAIAFLLIQKPLKAYTDQPQKIADRLLWFTLVGGLVGARLGHVFFYEPELYLQDPLSILKIWEGGLASHGGTIGVIVALILFRYITRKDAPNLTLLRIMDLVAVPTALVAFFIRLGNFFNQEIVGTQTTAPWAVIFGNPFDNLAIVPRHPSQLYEAIAYLVTFIILSIFQNRLSKNAGRIAGLFFILIFTSRFFIEFTKETQMAIIDQSFLQMGQWLSLPCIALGCILYFRKS